MRALPQSVASGEEALFASAEEVACAARAERRVLGHAADARHVVPAALALRVLGGLDGEMRFVVGGLHEFDGGDDLP